MYAIRSYYAYTPGVAQPCLEIQKNPELSYELTFLDMPNVKLAVSHEKGKLTINGMDNIELLISSNIGEPPKPIVITSYSIHYTKLYEIWVTMVRNSKNISGTPLLRF